MQALGILPSNLNWKHSLDLTLYAGQIVVVQGPNGAGKTSLLNALTGANTPRHGTCLLDGKPVGRLHGKQRRHTLAYMPQQEPRPAGFTVRERIALGAMDDASVDDAIEALGLHQLANRPVATLSGGEARRCTVAATIAQKSRCLIADEPTNHMDPEWTAKTGRILTRLARESETALLLVLHDTQLAHAIADRIITINPDGPTPDPTEPAKPIKEPNPIP